MSDLLGNAAGWLESQRHTHLTRIVKYQRGLLPPADVAATVGRTLFEVEDTNGGLQSIESRDFLIRAEDLAAEPEAGDTVIDGGIVYEVSPPHHAAPCFRYSDHTRLTYRIHTKKIGVEEE